MLRRVPLIPRYYSGPNESLNTYIRRSAGDGLAVTIAGNNILVTQNFNAISQNVDFQWANDRAADRVQIYRLAILAGADTVIEGVSINGEPGMIAGQTNTGGYIAAIVYGKCKTNDWGRGFVRQLAVIRTSGTAPTTVSASHLHLVSQYPFLRQCKVSTTAADTVRSVTLDQTFRRDIVLAVGINDVAAANQCTWTGTANNLSEAGDGTVGTFRVSTVTTQNFAFQSEGTGATVTSTWDVSSVNGVSLCAAVFSNANSMQ